MDLCSVCKKKGRTRCKLCNERVYCSIKCKEKDEVSHRLNCAKQNVTGSDCAKQEAAGSNCAKQKVTGTNCAKQEATLSNSAKQEAAKSEDANIVLEEMSSNDKNAALEQQELGNKAYLSKDFEAAMSHYNNAINLDKSDMTFVSNLSAVYFEMNDYWTCADYCLRAVEVGEQNNADKKLLAKTLNRLGNAFKLVGDLKNSKHMYIKANSIHKLSKTEKSIEKIDEMLKDNLKETDAIYDKEQGNEAFREKRYKDALLHYTKALQINDTDSKILSNRAAALTKLNLFWIGLLDCDQAIKIDDTFAKVHLRKGAIMESMGKHRLAVKSFQKVLTIETDCTEAAHRIVECNKKIEVSGKSKLAQATNIIPDAKTDFMSAMIQNLGGNKSGIKKIPKFHDEYASRFRSGSQQHIAKLSSVHTMFTMVNIVAINSKLQALEFEENAKSPDFFLKRWGVNNALDKDFYEFLNNAPMGSIYNQKVSAPYIPKFQTMKNYNLPQWILDFGKTHVSIGCVDFQQLLVGIFGSDEVNSPLIFYGIDAATVSIARCWILYQMMRNDADPISILQVWFSSAWVQKTFHEFTNACNALLASSSIKNEEEKKLLRHWINAKVKLEHVSDLWNKDIMKEERNSPFEPCANLIYEVDRLDYARYLFTGYIFVDKEKDLLCGNVTMFSTPEDMNCKKIDDENFFYTFNFYHPDFQYEKSLKASVEKFMLKKMKKVQNLVKDGRILMDFEVATVCPNNHDILTKIKSYNAYTIDWSNLMDYFTQNDFFKMARHINSEDTVHYFHMMNWVNCFKGASIFDYVLEDKIFLIEQAKKSENKIEQGLKEHCRKLSLVDYGLRSTTYVSTPNLVDHFLAIQKKDTYFKHIFGDEINVTSGDSNWSMFSRSHTTITGGFTFDKDQPLAVKL